MFKVKACWNAPQSISNNTYFVTERINLPKDTTGIKE